MMDNLRVFLWAGLAMMIWLSFSAWQRQFPSAPPAELEAVSEAPQAETPVEADLPSLPEAGPVADAAMPAKPESPTDSPAAPATVRVRTDVLDVAIDPGGRDARLRAPARISLHKDDPDNPGDGPLDALYCAIEEVTGKSVVVRNFRVQSATRGKDAQGESIVEVEHEGKTYRGRGVSTDTVEAGTRAFLNAINHIEIGAADQQVPAPTV